MTSPALHTGLRSIDIDLASLDLHEANSPQQRVLAFIEHSLSCIIREIQVRPFGNPVIVLKRIVDVRMCVNSATLEVERRIIDREVTYRFPGQRKDEAWRFGRIQEPTDGFAVLTGTFAACLGKILADIYVAIKTNVTVTKR